jgi:nucleoside-diphosphate-sugar epimerase
MRPPISCVSGATGFLASELVAQLLARGHVVRATVRSLANADRNACLTRLDGAAERLTLHEADLLRDGSFDEAVRGADYVFHTASPFIATSRTVDDPHAELFAPALEGTRNVFRSIAGAVSAGHAPPSRVVLTSSVAAVFGMAELASRPADEPFTEDDWNASSTPEGNPPGDALDLYRYSKVIAEREAWSLAGEHGLSLSTVLPSFIVGPPRTPRTDGESLQNMLQALQGDVPHRPDTPRVDVRDVAAAHVAAAELDVCAGKRFLTSSGRAMPRAGLLRLLRDKFPQYAFADEGEPVDRSTLREVFRSKNQPLLGFELRTPEESLVDMAEAMLAHGIVQPKAR